MSGHHSNQADSAPTAKADHPHERDRDIEHLSSIVSNAPVSVWIAELADPTKRGQRARDLIEWVFQTHGPRIRRMAAKLIADRFRGIIGPESVLNDTLGGLLKDLDPKEGEPRSPKFQHREDLTNLVITAVKCRVIDRIRREEAQKRNPTAGSVLGSLAGHPPSDQLEKPVEPDRPRVRLTGEGEGDVLGGGEKVSYWDEPLIRDYRPTLPVSPDRQPSDYYDQPPLQLLCAWLAPDLLAAANEAYERTDPAYRPIVDLAMQGHSVAEIATKLTMNETAVRRRWKLVEEQWAMILGVTAEAGE